MDKAGKTLTPTEYLEQSLTSERGVSEAVMARNRVRLMLVSPGR